MRAILALEDGTVYEGEAFGASGTVAGELCFNTSMSGYQEVLTDPSYRGQIVAMTYPLIGNTGCNAEDQESYQPHVRGFVIEELCPMPSNWRSEESLDDYLKRWNIPGIQGVDTRALTKRLRTAGAMRSILTTDPAISDEQAVAMAAASPPMLGADFVREVSTLEPYHWDADSKLSAQWMIPNAVPGFRITSDSYYRELPQARHRIVAYDFGIKHNILRSLRQTGFDIEVVPARTTASEVLAMGADGLFLSNGPGDPGALGYIHEQLRELIPKTPIFAICLGHQLIGHAVGAKTFKLKFGHRGGNQPVQDVKTGQVAITSQNHGFAIDPDSLPSEVEVSHINLNDGTVEGLRHRDYPVFSVQYHPEAAPGPQDARYFFQKFSDMLDAEK